MQESQQFIYAVCQKSFFCPFSTFGPQISSCTPHHCQKRLVENTQRREGGGGTLNGRGKEKKDWKSWHGNFQREKQEQRSASFLGVTLVPHAIQGTPRRWVGLQVGRRFTSEFRISGRVKEQFLRVQSAGRRCWKGRWWEGRSCDGESLPVARAGEGEGTMVLIEISFSKTPWFKQKNTV